MGVKKRRETPMATYVNMGVLNYILDRLNSLRENLR